MPPNTPETIEHGGTIADINQNIIAVCIKRTSSCGSCYAKGACSMKEEKDIVVEVPNPRIGGTYQIGEKVAVLFKKSSGLKAIFLGYLLPFFVVVATMFSAARLTKREEIVGLVAIAILVPYYFSLYILRDQLKEAFTFEIKKKL